MPVDRAPRRPSRRSAQIRPKRTYNAQLLRPRLPDRPRLRRHTVIGILLLVIAAVLVPTHLAEHAGVWNPLPGKLEDLFLGFPMAGVLGISGFVALIWR